MDCRSPSVPKENLFPTTPFDSPESVAEKSASATSMAEPLHHHQNPLTTPTASPDFLATRFLDTKQPEIRQASCGSLSRSAAELRRARSNVGVDNYYDALRAD